MRNRDPHWENIENILHCSTAREKINHNVPLRSFNFPRWYCRVGNLPSHHGSATHQGISISQPCYEEKCMECVVMRLGCELWHWALIQGWSGLRSKLVFIKIRVGWILWFCSKNMLQFLLISAHNQIKTISISRHIYYLTVYHCRCGLFIRSSPSVNPGSSQRDDSRVSGSSQCCGIRCLPFQLGWGSSIFTVGGIT